MKESYILWAVWENFLFFCFVDYVVKYWNQKLSVEFQAKKLSRAQYDVETESSASGQQQLPPVTTGTAGTSRPPSEVTSRVQKHSGAATQPSGSVTAKTPTVIAACNLCLHRGNVSKQGTGKGSDRCSATASPHVWEANKVYVLMPSRKRVNQLPKRIPMNNNFALCRHMLTKRDCSMINGGCQFAHSEEEIELWKWMVTNKGNVPVFC
jgi:hypothetical protein